MQRKIKYMNVQQQRQKCTALQIVVFTPLPTISSYAPASGLLCVVYIHVYAVCICWILYWFIGGFCSIVISVFDPTARFDFRTENLSHGWVLLWLLIFFSPRQLRANWTTSRPKLSSRSLKREKKQEVTPLVFGSHPRLVLILKCSLLTLHKCI